MRIVMEGAPVIPGYYRLRLHTMPKIDVFNHIFPKPFFDRLQAVTVNRGAIKRWLNIPFLHDVDVRFRMLEEFGPEYRQILSLSAPPIEAVNPDRRIAIDLARLANDSMADLVRQYPDRFPGFISFRRAFFGNVSSFRFDAVAIVVAVYRVAKKKRLEMLT